MENRYALFHVALMLNVLTLVVSFTGVISATNITDVMRNDTNICEASKFLYDLECTKDCASLPYPSASLNFSEKTVNTLLCLGIYDTAYKICQLKNPPLSPSFLEQSVPNVSQTQQKKFCDSLQGFTSSYDKINPLLKSLVENLNKQHRCEKICFDFNDKLKQVCAIFAWIKKIDDTEKANEMEIKNDPITPDKSSIIQSNETASRIIAETNKKISEVKETNKPNNSENDNNTEKNHSNVSNLDIETEKTKSDTEKPGQKFGVLSGTQSHKSVSPILEEKNNNIADNKETDEMTRQFPVKSESQDPSINNLGGIVPNNNVVNAEGKKEEIYEQNTDDLKTSTLSENTQDHYDAANPEDVDDVEDTIQQSTRNQNENIQEVFEQKSLQYPNVRTEDDSYYLTYFTVVTLACIAGLIGYLNKQKILAIVLEGRRSRNNRGRRRPSTANYRKLDCTLEEAVTSQCNANVTHVIY